MEVSEDAVIWGPSLNHDGLAQVIFLKILGSLQAADIFFVTSEYSRDLVRTLAARYNCHIDANKITIMPPPADPFFQIEQPIAFKRGENTVLYSSRLYEQYGTDFLLSIIDHYKDSSVRFIVTDLFSNKSVERKRLDARTEQYRQFLRHHKNVIVREDGGCRKTYRDEIVAQAYMVLGPYRRNANWSMSMVDAFMAGVPGIGPHFASFPEFVPSGLLYHDKKSAIELIDRLLSDEAFWTASSQRCLRSYQRFLPNRVVDIFFKALEGL
jgi:glycosyltransferase involved in cell wall biosynthesis